MTTDDQQIAELLAALSPDERDELERVLAKTPPGEALGMTPALSRTTTRAKHRVCFDFSKVESAVRLLERLPAKGETFHCLMGGDFNAADLIPAIQCLADEPLDELHIATLGFNKTNTAQICALFDEGLVKSISLACSHYFAATDKSTFEFATEELQRRGQRIVATRTHAKVLAVRIGRAGYAVESSANLRSCNNQEQLAFTCSLQLFRFHRAWLNHIHQEAGR